MDLVKLDLLKVICPACGQQVEAVARDSRVKGYCAIAKQHVDFLIETQPAVETKAEMSAADMPIKEGRDNRGRFIKGNIPLNKSTPSS